MTLPRENLSKMIKGLYHYEDNPTIVTGRFTIGAGATFYPTQTGGQGSVVTRAGVGDYLITLDDLDIVDVISATACIQDTAGAHTDLIVRAEDVTLGPPTTIDLESYAAAVATDILTANLLHCHYQVIYSRGWHGQPDTNPIGYYHHVTDAVLVAGRVMIGAAGAVGAHHGAGYVMTKVGGAGTGTYLLTFTQAFNQFLGGRLNAGNASAAGGDLSCNFGVFTAGAAGAATLQIFTNTGAGAADPANGGAINFAVYLGGESSGA